ncbi:hypothetical protein ACFLSF_02010 [Candidatus Bipolaricaulota bacterium]
MRKRLAVSVTISVILVTFLIVGGPVIAAPSDPHLNRGSEINAGQCQEGTLVINVTYRIVSIDSAVGGFYWAYDYINRHVQVWQTDENAFCAVVQDTGAFVTDGGLSPGGYGNTIAAGTRGTIQGGCRLAIAGSLRSSPAYRTKGNIGTFDYNCDIGTGSCGAKFDWIAAYFDPGTAGYEWWGWIYRAGRNGTWVNSQDGNEGDITD